MIVAVVELRRGELKSVLISGASSGFGRGAAIELARSGWQVFATMRNVAKGAELLSAVQDEGLEGALSIVALDVTDPSSIDAALGQVLEETDGHLDVLVNNAGFSVLGAFEDLSDADCRAQMETNFFGTLALTRAVLPTMRTANRGRVLVVSSNAVNAPHPMLSMYAASKWALEGWAEALAMEVAPWGIEVGVLQPGAHRTEFADNVQFRQPDGSAYTRWMEAAMPGIANLDRWGRDPALGATALADAVCAPELPFLQQVGEDSRCFAALKAVAPYEARALALRAIVGIPGKCAFVEDEGAPTVQGGVTEEVLGAALARLAEDREIADLLRQALAGQ